MRTRLNFVRIILSVGSEIDVVAKSLCAKIKPKEKPQNIDEYREIIVAKHSRISTIKIAAPKYRLTFTPWQDWGSNRNPGWWKVYNKVKHQRDVYYTDATLQNALLGSSALCVLLGYLYPQFFASKVISIGRPFLFFDDKYGVGNFILTGRKYALP